MPLTKHISVIIPVYNAEKYVAEAIQSVLNQSIDPYEIIAVDDGSTDGSAEEIEKFAPKVNLIKQENKGISGARNKGVLASNGSFIAFLDADDIWTEDHLELLLKPFEEKNNVGLVIGHVEQFTDSDCNKKHTYVEPGKKLLPGYVAGASLIKKDLFEKIGLFNDELTLAEYIDWFSRVKDSGISTRLIKEVVLKRRIHSDNIGIRQKDHIKDYTKVLMASIRRKRQNEKKK